MINVNKVKTKSSQSKLIDSDVERWLAQGNKPYQCKHGETAYTELVDFTRKTPFVMKDIASSRSQRSLSGRPHHGILSHGPQEAPK